MKIQRLTALLAVLLGLVVLAFVLLGTPQPGTVPPETGRTSAAQSSGAPRTPLAGVVNPSRLAEVNASDLPVEARRTLDLIAKGLGISKKSSRRNRRGITASSP
jgi:ribonuclease T1